MNIKTIKKLIFTFIITFSLFLFVNLGDSKDLVAGITDTPDKSVFVDIVKAIDEVYTAGTIKIIFCQSIDSWENVEYEKVDFHIPQIMNPNVLFERRPIRYTTENIGKMAIVIYSNIEKPITKKMLDVAQKNVYKEIPFPYKIETDYELGSFEVPYTAKQTKNLNQAIKKLGSKSIDAVIWTQEEGDLMLKKLKIKSIQREFWIDFHDTIIVANNNRGDEIDKILSSAIKKIKKSGMLNKLYSKLHVPYKEWQPSKTDW